MTLINKQLGGLRKIWFDGETYFPSLDRKRLTSQLMRVFALMKDGQWRTLYEIQTRCGGSESGISARIRDFRKERFGGHEIKTRRRTEGTWEYKLEVSWDIPTPQQGSLL